jgi:hypothetical protein
LAKRLLERFDWSRFEPEPELAELADGADLGSTYEVPYAAGIPGVVAVVYVPVPRSVNLRGIASGVPYDASAFDPASGETVPLGKAAGGDLVSPPKGWGHDWVLVLTASSPG